MALLLEREAELRELARVVDEACAGRGRLVFVEGPPGIGKTRLLAAARELAREREMEVLSARATDLDRAFPFGVARQLFEPMLSGGGEERRAALLRGAARPAAALLSGAAPEEEGAESSEEAAFAHFHALYWLTANLAERSPAALAIDDVHWADAGSLRFLRFLLPRLADLPVLVAVAVRPREPGADRRALDALATDPLAVVLRPLPLSDAAVATFADAELGDVPDRTFSEACRRATGGNPFLLRELLRELAAERVAPTADSAPLVRQLAPPTVARTVLLRLARLPDDASALARAVVVLGEDSPLQRSARLAGLSDERAADAAAALVRADILAATRPPAFVHPIIRAAVHADIEPGALAAGHRRAAALLAEESAGPDAIAVHLLATEPARDPSVVATLREAAARARARGAAGTSAACLRRALAEPPPAAERAAVVVELGSAEMQAGDPVAAAEHFEEGIRIAGDPRSRAATARERALALLAADRRDEAFAVLERAVEEVADVDAGLALWIEASLIGIARAERSRLAWVRERLARYRGRLTGGTVGERMLLATQAHLDAFSPRSGESAAALADVAERALGSGQLRKDAGGTSLPFFYAIDVLLLADRAEPARRALDEAVEEARRRGSAPAFALACGVRCGLFAREGALAAAEADGRSCAELSLEQGWFLAAPNMLGALVGVLVDRGELDDAERFLAVSGMSARTAGHDLGVARVVHARARLRAARGDVAGARADLARPGLPRARWNTYPTLVPPVLVAPQLAEEDPGDARELSERMLREAQGWGTPRAIGIALHAHGLLMGGARGLELLGDAVGVLEESPARLEYARALTDLGAALRRANRRAAARDPLRRALDAADACGARPLAARARQELHATGARPRRPRLSGVEALTASERRVADMAAGGLSNPEIAQALFVTTKTVETHLGNTYRKLDIKSRAQLAAALRTAADGHTRDP